MAQISESKVKRAARMGYNISGLTVEQAQAQAIADYKALFPYCDQFAIRFLELVGVSSHDPRLSA